MEHYQVLILGLISLFIIETSAEVEVSVEPSKMERKSGDPPQTYTMTCSLNVKLMTYINDYRVSWISPEGKTLNRVTEVAAGLSHEKYKFDLDQTTENNKEQTILKMIIHGADDSDGGRYTCRVTDKSGNNPVDKTVLINVLYDTSDFYLRVGDKKENKFTEYITDKIQLIQNNYKVQCHSEGSNPGADIKLFLRKKDGTQTPITIDAIQSFPMDFGHNSQYTVDAAQHVDLLPEHDEVMCEIQVPKGGYPAKKLGVGLHIISVEPEIACANATAIMDEERVYLRCKIEAYHKPTKYIWSMGDTNEEITNEDADGDGNHIVTFADKQTETGRYVIDAILEIKKANKQVFDRRYYLEVEAGHGKQYQQIVNVKQISGTSTATTVRLTSAVCILSLLLAFLH